MDPLECFEHRFDVIRLDQQEKVVVSLEVRQKGASLMLGNQLLSNETSSAKR